MLTQAMHQPRFATNQGSINHPSTHRLKLVTETPAFSPRYVMQRSHSLSIDNIQFGPRTFFELERPQSLGTPRIVINVATSFKSPRSPKRRVPTFPVLATYNVPKKKNSVPELGMSTNNSYGRRSARNVASSNSTKKQSTTTDRPISPMEMDLEKQTMIEQWIEDTSKALSIKSGEKKSLSRTKTLPVIKEH
ncbi:hypothetical protein CHS0354_027260 [Potamilus streckersoni]|uniref:Uncharacterized protein n=1 Tax=Potamilus streckersoni TaxID=2493646 RepID=A0AAE0VM09_9BIVA|nr:hypothetical protein CHS0354_027260 [Potamilus streckersoni]